VRAQSILIRAPNHLGDFVLALPALTAAPDSAILVARRLAPLAALALRGRPVIPLAAGPIGFLAGVARLRRPRFSRAILLTPSFSSALLTRLAGISACRGRATDGRSALLSDPVPTAVFDGVHRAAEYWHLVTGSFPPRLPAPAITLPAEPVLAWRATPAAREGLVAVFPGSNAPARRWDPARFAELVHRLAAAGHPVVVLGGEKERDLTESVAGRSAIDLGGKTDLVALAACLSECRLLITNDSGPMHLAAALGTATISLWGAGDPARTAPMGDHQVILRHPELPCVPCVRNRCPRHGRGTMLPEAQRECMALIDLEEVWHAALAALGGPKEGARAM
jgi:lipopolysaccharide heptosyltransferase II